MLVLSRKKNEQIVIGDRIFVTLVEVKRGHVRLGIDAPKDVPVHRKEVFEALKDRPPLPKRGSEAEEMAGSPSD